MNYRPYVWMGEHHDAHVLAFEALEREQELIERAKMMSNLYNSGDMGLLRAHELQNLTLTAAFITGRDEASRRASIIFGGLGSIARGEMPRA